MKCDRYDMSDAYLEKEFRSAGIRQGWWGARDPMVLAVSGGGDSVALLWFFRMFWPGEIVVAHVEHGIRGRSSEEDALFVAEISRKFGVPCSIVHTAVPRLRRRGETLEEGARRIRYAILGIVREEISAWGIAFGHNADDRIETMLLNLFRGTGLFGLAGIPERRGRIVRPLLAFSREKLRRILEERAVPWREDETNNDVTFSRNRIRRELLPWIENRLNPRVRDRLFDLAEETSVLRSREEERAGELLRNIECLSPLFPFLMRKSAFSALAPHDKPLLLRAIGRKLHLRALSRSRVGILCRLCESGGRWTFQWQGGWEVCCGGDMVAWIPVPVPGPFPVESGWIPLPGDVFSWGGWTFGFAGGNPVQWSNTTFSVMPAAAMVRSGNKDAQCVPWFCREYWPVLRIGVKFFVPFWRDPMELSAGEGLSVAIRYNSCREVRVNDDDTF